MLTFNTPLQCAKLLLSSLRLNRPVNSVACKNILDRFWEWLAEMLRHSAFLGWTAEHFEVDSRNLAGIFLHISVQKHLSTAGVSEEDFCAVPVFCFMCRDSVN